MCGYCRAAKVCSVWNLGAYCVSYLHSDVTELLGGNSSGLI